MSIQNESLSHLIGVRMPEPDICAASTEIEPLPPLAIMLLDELLLQTIPYRYIAGALEEHYPTTDTALPLRYSFS